MIGIAGALVFQPFVGAILPIVSGGNFGLALATIPACLTLAAVAVLFLPEYRHPDHQPQPARPGDKCLRSSAGVRACLA